MYKLPACLPGANNGRTVCVCSEYRDIDVATLNLASSILSTSTVWMALVTLKFVDWPCGGVYLWRCVGSEEGSKYNIQSTTYKYIIIIMLPMYICCLCTLYKHTSWMYMYSQLYYIFGEHYNYLANEAIQVIGQSCYRKCSNDVIIIINYLPWVIFYPRLFFAVISVWKMPIFSSESSYYHRPHYKRG